MNIDIKTFEKERKNKKRYFIRQNNIFINNSDYEFYIILGSCASVVLCGIDDEKKVWIGVNHLFRFREENYDMALVQIAQIYNGLQEKNAGQITCLGLFGAGYRENSIAGTVAQRNVINILEALSFYNLTIELFQTGFSQALNIIVSDARKSILIKHKRIDSVETRIIEMPLDRLFSGY